MACNKDEETTEHVLKCEIYKKWTKHKLTFSDWTNDMKDTEWLMEAAKVMKRIEEIKNIMK